MENNESKTGSVNVLRNLLWRLAERVGAKGVEFAVSIVLARLLEPALFGTVALITVFITIIQVFVDSGLANALIQKKDADDTDFSTVFYFNVFFCLLLYAALFFAAPLIASFYNDQSLVPLVRVLGLTIIISGLKNVQQAYVSRHMLFKRFFYATLGGTITAAAVGVIMAYKGFGVWAIVAQHLVNLLMDTVILWFTVRWRPKKLFSFERLKKLYSFGWKLLASQLIETVYGEIRQLLIGKLYTKADLAFYNRAKQFPQFITANINTSINSVLFPAMSDAQDDPARVKQMTRRAIKTSTYLMAPLMVGLAVCGEAIVLILLTEKWLPLVPFLYVFCFTHLFLPLHTANLNAIKAMGRSDLFLKLEIIKKIVGITALLITIRISVMAMAYSLLFTSVASQIINSWPNRKLLNYGYLEQIKDIIPNILAAGLMGGAVFLVRYLGLSPWLTLLIQVPLGAAVYLLESRIFRMESYYYVFGMIKKFLRIGKKKGGEAE